MKTWRQQASWGFGTCPNLFCASCQDNNWDACTSTCQVGYTAGSLAQAYQIGEKETAAALNLLYHIPPVVSDTLFALSRLPELRQHSYYNIVAIVLLMIASL